MRGKSSVRLQVSLVCHCDSVDLFTADTHTSEIRGKWLKRLPKVSPKARSYTALLLLTTPIVLEGFTTELKTTTIKGDFYDCPIVVYLAP